MTPTANKSAEAPRQTAMSAAANAPIPPTPPRKTAATSATLATANDVSVANMPGNGPTVSTTPISVPTSTPITHPAVQNAAHQIAAQAQLVQSGQTAEMRLRLRPPDLGEVQVTIRRTATGSLAVHLIPATSEASAALTTNLHLLRGALEPHSQGQSAQVTLTQHHASGSPQHGGRHNEQTPEDTAAANHDTPAQTTASNTLPRPRPNLGTIDYDA
jgi:flagellar hook-length control protein FliK